MTVAALLLLGLGLLLGAEGQCFFNRTQEYCVCYNLSQESMGSIIQCLAATAVEFRGGELEKYAAFPIDDLDPSAIDMLSSLLIRKIIFGDLLVPMMLLSRVLRFFSYTQVQEVVFDSCVFRGRGDWAEMAGRSLPISALSFHNVTGTPVGSEQDLSGLGTWLQALQNLSVTASHVTRLPCSTGRLLTALRSLDLAHNSLGDGELPTTFCTGAFPELRALALQHNNLTSYGSVCESVRLLRELQQLDLSHNRLTAGLASSCQWPAALRVFNLSDAGLDRVPEPLPPTLEVLDVSCNRLHAADISLSSLKQLFLSYNLLQAVPCLRSCPALDTLHLDNNSLAELPWGELKLLRHLRRVSAAGNPFNCSCQGAGGLQALAGAGLLGPGWPQAYTCSSPPSYRGHPAQDVPVSALHCHGPAVIGALCAVLTLLGVAAAACLLRHRARPCRRG
ncbi:monocyte differentiation antigen CD14 [Colius striatus]|uniref:monocyte differentiation antigen CD14 n=1 Tax=Colius striatus TaxID=57412 RepID=UPI002B1DA945|nr:monocyte differentiation antigen CD14 [Colius striatus]XP_061858689.1 monocyte differentiation antigen CD14 [Colius striatus]